MIALIKASKNPEEARTGLIREIQAPDLQAQAILDMKLQRLTGLERDKIIQEYEEVLKEIARLNEILASDALVMKIIRTSCSLLKRNTAIPGGRRSSPRPPRSTSKTSSRTRRW